MPRHKPIEIKGQEALFEPPPYERPDKSTVRVPLPPLWTENKAKLIERYLFYFVLVTKHGTYIDGFSGPQDPDNPDSWACKLVLESHAPFLREFWLCDLDPSGVAALKSMVSHIERPKYRRIEVVCGDFNVKVNEILRGCKI